MSKKNESNLSWGRGYAMSAELPHHIIGKILTLADLLPLNEAQHASFKTLVKQTMWDTLSEHTVVNLSPETFTALKEKQFEMLDESRIAGTPPTEV